MRDAQVLVFTVEFGAPEKRREKFFRFILASVSHAAGNHPTGSNILRRNISTTGFVRNLDGAFDIELNRLEAWANVLAWQQCHWLKPVVNLQCFDMVVW